MAVVYIGILLILGLQHPSCLVSGLEYIGFVVDDTGSMADEISVVSSWIENCVTGKNDNCRITDDTYWLAVSFNDPGTGDLSGPWATKDSANLISYIKGLDANGGGDCPEMAMSGTEKLVSAVPDQHDDCKIFLLTDATAKDSDKALAVFTLLDKKGCTTIPILTGCCGKCPEEMECPSPDPEYCHDHAFERKKRSVTAATFDDDKTLFYKLAEKTNGSVHLIDPDLSHEEMLEVLETTVTLATSQWSPYSKCSVTCGIGTKKRICLRKGAEVSSERCGSGSPTAECIQPACPVCEDTRTDCLMLKVFFAKCDTFKNKGCRKTCGGC